jgi:hypothetical protein
MVSQGRDRPMQDLGAQVRYVHVRLDHDWPESSSRNPDLARDIRTRKQRLTNWTDQNEAIGRPP